MTSARAPPESASTPLKTGPIHWQGTATGSKPSYCVRHNSSSSSSFRLRMRRLCHAEPRVRYSAACRQMAAVRIRRARTGFRLAISSWSRVGFRKPRCRPVTLLAQISCRNINNSNNSSSSRRRSVIHRVGSDTRRESARAANSIYRQRVGTLITEEKRHAEPVPLSYILLPVQHASRTEDHCSTEHGSVL